jgi:predicted metal-dependent phosphoesterase TrpH
MPDYIDLHIHSNHSDGRQTPKQIVDASIALGLRVVSITDHDAISGHVAAISYADEKGIELISGIELSASKSDDDIHILGYYVRPDDSQLQESLDRFRRIRLERGKKMLERLAGLGIRVDFGDVLEAAGGAPLGRPHLAEAMVKHGCVGSYNEAFYKYLSLGGPVYVPKAKLTPAQAIDLIHEAGGVAAMAHPALTKRDGMIEELAASGLDGIEIFHPTHNAATRKRYRKLAEKYGLFLTGGSDSHNRKGRYGDIGDEKVPFEYLDKIKKRWQQLADRQR